MLLKVVIVEDEEIIRKGLTLALNWLDMGCIIVGTARDGAEGLETIRREQPDIVLTDIKMPKMNGLKMIETAIKDQHFYSLVLTSYSEFELARQAIHMGVTDYLLKPVDEDELKESLDKIRQQIAYASKYEKIEKMSRDRILTVYDEWRIFESAKNSMDPYVKRAYEFVKQHYKEKVSINQVAESLGVSTSYLSRKLKAGLNTTFVDLLNQYRIKKALNMLSEGTMRIYEISDELGFSEYKHFCGVFKKYTNVTPSEFIKNGGVAGGGGEGKAPGGTGGFPAGLLLFLLLAACLTALACVALLLFVRRYIAAKMQVVDMLVQSIFTAEGHCGYVPGE